jgi:hypothetical protein
MPDSIHVSKAVSRYWIKIALTVRDVWISHCQKMA